jgi:quinol monooxygenase YgiN
MSDALTFVSQLTVKAGQAGAVPALMADMAAAAGAEPGTLGYEWHTGDPPSTLLMIERYADADAAVRHLDAWMPRFGARFTAVFAPGSFFVCGPASAALQQALAQANPTWLPAGGGFRR